MNNIKTILSVLLLLVSISTISAQEKKEEMFREESMRKFPIGNTTVQLKKGTVWVYNYGEIKLHAYETKDFFDSYIYLLEKEGKVVLLECPMIKDNYEEIIDYIAGLGYKEVDLIVSYHPIGAQFIKTDKLKFNVYSMKHAVDNYVSGPGAPSLIGLKNRFGEMFDESIYTEYINLKEGENEVGGIKFELSNVDFAFDVAIPEINSVHPHMLAHDRHALIFSFDFLDAYIAQLKRYQKVNYEMYLASHGGLETRGDVTIKLHYLKDLKEIAKASSNKKEFIDKMNEAYPNFGWPFYLEGTANFLFANKDVNKNIEDKLVLEVDLENDAISLSHNIENFFFSPTANYQEGSKKNVNNIKYTPLKDHLVATALVRMNGEVVGIATETEIVYLDDPENLRAHSMWSIKLNAPGLNGFISTEQMEDASKGAALMQEVFENPTKNWEDKWHLVPTSIKGTRVQHASGDLAKYNGGIFQEFNGTNQADLNNFGKFRGKIIIEVYPKIN